MLKYSAFKSRETEDFSFYQRREEKRVQKLRNDKAKCSVEAKKEERRRKIGMKKKKKKYNIQIDLIYFTVSKTSWKFYKSLLSR